MKKIVFIIILTLSLPFWEGEFIYGQIITTFAGSQYIAQGVSPGLYTGDGGAASDAKLFRPSSVAADNLGNIYICDNFNNVIRKVDTAGIISTFAGNHTTGFSGDGGAATAAQLNLSQGRITTDMSGNLYISDYGNDRVRIVNKAGIINTIAGSGFHGYGGDGGQATLAKLASPTGLSTDANGNLYIADPATNVIRKVNKLGIISTFAGNHFYSGTNFYSGDGGYATAATLNAPVDVTTDIIGNVYIADWNNNVIRKVDTLGIISTFAGNHVLGDNGDGGQATAAELYSPNGITTDLNGNVYISQFSNAMARKVNTEDIINVFAGGGNCTGIGNGYCGDGGQATAAKINVVVGLTADMIGNIYITDVVNNVVRKISAPNHPTNNNTIIIPNIFTPNGDSINDTFFIKGADIINFSCKIFDRWGILVYQWSDINGGWNGKDKNGAASNDGTYYYIISYTDNTGKANTKNGFFQLLK